MWTRHHWLAVTFCLLAFASASAISDFVFERVPHVEDELAFYFQAQVFAQGRAYVDAPPEPVCFFAPFVLDYEGKRFGKYPPGWSALLALGMILGQTWWVAASCAAITIALIFRIGATIANRAIGALAAFLAITSPFVVMLSGSLMSHTATLTFSSAFFWSFYQMWRGRLARRWSLIAGLALGFAFAIRPFTALAIAIPAGDIVLIRAMRDRDFARALLIAIGFASVASVVPIFNAIWTGDPFANTYTMFWHFDKVGFGADVGTLPGGHTLGMGLGLAATSLGWLAITLHGVPGLSFTFIVAAFLFKPRQSWELFLAATALSLTLMHGLYWTGGSLFAPRYLHEATFAWIILSAIGIARVGTWMKQRGTIYARAYLALLVLALAFDLFVYLPHDFREYRGLYGITGAPREILSNANLHHALVLVSGGDRWEEYAVPFTLNAPTLDGDVVYARACGALNEKLITHFPGRRVYFFDARTMTVISGR